MQGYLRAYVLTQEEGRVFLENGKDLHLTMSHMMHCINYGTSPCPKVVQNSEQVM
jgi:hypothetical protein